MVTFIKSGLPLKRDTLSEVETELRFAFPDEFIKFYLAQNGGRPLEHLFRTENSVLIVSYFFPVADLASENRFEKVFRDLKVSGGIIPAFLVPFACDPGGDFFCFSSRNEDFGAIWLFQLDYSDLPARAGKFVCRNLDVFLNGLVLDDTA